MPPPSEGGDDACCSGMPYLTPRARYSSTVDARSTSAFGAPPRMSASSIPGAARPDAIAGAGGVSLSMRRREACGWVVGDSGGSIAFEGVPTGSQCAAATFSDSAAPLAFTSDIFAARRSAAAAASASIFAAFAAESDCSLAAARSIFSSSRWPLAATSPRRAALLAAAASIASVCARASTTAASASASCMAAIALMTLSLSCAQGREINRGVRGGAARKGRLGRSPLSPWPAFEVFHSCVSHRVQPCLALNGSCAPAGRVYGPPSFPPPRSPP